MVKKCFNNVVFSHLQSQILQLTFQEHQTANLYKNALQFLHHAKLSAIAMTSWPGPKLIPSNIYKEFPAFWLKISAC